MFNGLMSFSDFVFSNNPYLVTVGSKLEKGSTVTTVSGEGEFIGEDAFQQYKALKNIFHQGKEDWLRLPRISPFKAKLISLDLIEDARENIVFYRFSFEEVIEEFQTAVQPEYIRVGDEKSLWDIEKNYGTSVEMLFTLNPSIISCYAVCAGDVIRIL